MYPPYATDLRTGDISPRAGNVADRDAQLVTGRVVAEHDVVHRRVPAEHGTQ